MRISFFLLLLLPFFSSAQLKYLIEDFEGLADGNSGLKPNGLFAFGNIDATIKTHNTEKDYSGSRYIMLLKEGEKDFGGWGKGVGMNMELDYSTDYVNFYINVSQPCNLKIELQEDDNGDAIYQKEKDDSWINTQKIEGKGEWQLISIPLLQFKDDNAGGDGSFNCTYRDGKLLTIIFSFPANDKNSKSEFDFLCLSKGKLPVGAGLFDAPQPAQKDGCSLGVWSTEGNRANFADIPHSFEKNFSTDKKLAVAHFFQPFAIGGDTKENHYPSVERINKVIEAGYIPMITLEDHFVKTSPSTKQPNLYSIVEGHFDGFFKQWARQIKQVKGVVLLRILHEFNGDWYPWCTVNNGKNPDVLVRAFHRIVNAFRSEGVNNVRFIWCPNSMSIPQERWNFIMEAYPGDEYVDFVALDIYNGAGKSLLWRSFRKEGIENYFVLTQRFPTKPLLICEVASRERRESESGSMQNKGEWIRQMSSALQTDMAQIRLLSWFNETNAFKINSSREAVNGFEKEIMKSPYFINSKEGLEKWIK
jgi:beta-mannanase